MDTQSTLGSLNLFTLVAVFVVVLGIALWYFRKKENRHPMGENEGIKTDLDAAATRNEDPPRARDAR